MSIHDLGSPSSQRCHTLDTTIGFSFSPSTAGASEGTSELSSKSSFAKTLKTWLLAWVSLWLVRTAVEVEGACPFEDSVGDHPFGSHSSEAASMRNQVVKHGGSGIPTHTSACTTHCGSKCKGRCKMMSRHFHMAMRNGSNGRLRMKNMRGAFGPTPRSRTPQVTANEDGCAAGWIFTQYDNIIVYMYTLDT